MLDKLQKRVCVTNGPSLSDCLVPLAYLANVAFSLCITLVAFIWTNWTGSSYLFLISGIWKVPSEI